VRNAAELTACVADREQQKDARKLDRGRWQLDEVFLWLLSPLSPLLTLCFCRPEDDRPMLEQKFFQMGCGCRGCLQTCGMPTQWLHHPCALTIRSFVHC
jgi:hypothetical protein